MCLVAFARMSHAPPIGRVAVRRDDIGIIDETFSRDWVRHGEVDDNVHLSNTMQMAVALQKAGKQFDMMVYPRAAHAVHEPSQDYQLMLTSLAFLRRELLTKDSGP